MEKSSLSSKQRALAAIEHRALDRVPIDYSAKPEVTERLQSRLGAASLQPLLEQLHVDFWYVAPVDRIVFQHQLYCGPDLPRYPDGSWEDIWGVRFRPVEYETTTGPGVYQETVRAPLAEATTVAEVERHRWPKGSWYDYSGVAAECDRFADWATVGGAWATIFGDAWRLQGIEVFLTNMVYAPEVIQAIVERVEQFYTEANTEIFRRARSKLDIFYMGSDFGTQKSMFMSRKMWKQFFAPGIARATALARKHGLKVMFHTCGAILDLIPDFIEMGVDILDPVQVAADGMSLVKLKREFGRDLCFHGGISTQTVLPFGTAQEVRDEVRRTLDIMMPGAGYIFQPDQSLQPDVPLDNILAMYETAWEHGLYR